MNILKVTQTQKWFVVEFSDNKLHMLNGHSLVFFLKNQVGLDKTAIASCLHYLQTTPDPLILDLDKTTRKKVS